jgi:hypothetical protein
LDPCFRDIALIAWIDYRQRQRGVHLKLDNGPLPSGGPASALVPDDNAAAKGQNDDKRAPSKPEHETVRWITSSKNRLAHYPS